MAILKHPHVEDKVGKRLIRMVDLALQFQNAMREEGESKCVIGSRSLSNRGLIYYVTSGARAYLTYNGLRPANLKIMSIKIAGRT